METRHIVKAASLMGAKYGLFVTKCCKYSSLKWGKILLDPCHIPLIKVDSRCIQVKMTLMISKLWISVQ